MRHTVLILLSVLLTLNQLSGSITDKDNMAKAALVKPNIPAKTITVGGADADIVGFTSRSIQTAVDALKSYGGGTLLLKPGTYQISAPIELAENISLQGSGATTVLRKIDGVKSNFALDADYGELLITLEDASAFKSGMGIQIYDEKQKNGWAVTTAKITEIVGNILYIDNYLGRDYRADHNGAVSSSCSIISAVSADNIHIANLTVDGNRDNNEYLNGCRGGGIYLHKVKSAIVEDVIVKNFDGDGISWQITEDVTVRNCDVSGCTNSGLHPGTGSPRSTITNNTSHNNDRDGLFICWRVQNGLVAGNKFLNNGRYGLCTGHKDTDMLFENNLIKDNGSDGVHFRGERESNAPHRSTFRNNIIENNGRTVDGGGYGFSINSPARDVVLIENVIRDTGSGSQKAAVYIYKSGLPVNLENNEITGHENGDVQFEEKK
jgi:hypothetical protein